MLKKQNSPWTDKQHYWIKRVAWLNILAQIAFPVAGAFTPTVVSGKATPVTQEEPPVENRQTASVSDISENYTERWLASAASRAAGMLKNGNVVESAKSQLHSMAVSEANQAVQNWLQRYGTVKLQANVNSRGRLEGSQFDMLLPLYDTEKQLAFTQFGLRRLDRRTTVNVGLGQRHFLDTGLFGYNAFFDHDVTRDHTRLGLGAEYARDFMKFAANGYFRASSWRDGKKLKDYAERPANGFDLRAEGNIPAYPQLGGKLIYEQYFGHEVGLLSEEQRQKNPSVLTIGASYTPIPLVTLGIDRKQSAQGSGETLFNLGLNYELGTPWSRQIDPDVVTFKRSLQGGRYDLVERNNQIVLEYRKKELIRLSMGERISGHGGEVVPLTVSISTKYGLKEIVWDTANLVAAGGKLEKRDTPPENMIAYSVGEGTRYLLTLPPYHVKGNNTYTLSGTAYDNQGNASERAETQVQVTALAIDLKGSGFELAKQSMLADGKTQTVLRLKLIDKVSKPVSGAAGNITLTSDFSGLQGEGKSPEWNTEIKEVPEGSGIYEITVTAGTQHGEWKITATVDGHTLNPVTLTFSTSLGELIDETKSQFRYVGKKNLPVDESGLLVLDLLDKENNPITGVANNLSLDVDTRGLYGDGKKPEITEVQEVPLGSGHYEWKVTGGGKQGRVPVTLTVNAQKIRHTATLTFGKLLAETIDMENSRFISVDKTLAADGQQQTTLILDLKDKEGKPINRAAVSIKITSNELAGSGTNPAMGEVMEKPVGSGVYKVIITAGTKIGLWKAIATVDSKPLKQAVEIQFDAVNTPTLSGLSVTGVMAQGEKLNATYQFHTNGGNETDHSFFAWGTENTTADAVKTLAKAAEINTVPRADMHQDGLMLSGSVKDKEKVPEYTISQVAAGKVLELSVLAASAEQVSQLPPETVVLRKGEQGNKTTGGNHEGGVIDPNAKPDIHALKLEGILEKGKTLTAKYIFEAGTGDGMDKSGYTWCRKQLDGTPDGTTCKTGIGPDRAGQISEVDYLLEPQDVNRIVEFSIRAENALSVKADDTKTINSSMKWEAGNHSGGGSHQGGVIDPDQDPVITHLTLVGPLTIGKKITATYVFDDKGGHPDDKSLYAWGVYESGEDDPTIRAIENSNNVIVKSGHIPESFELTDQDAGKIIALTVRPNNGKGNNGSIERTQGMVLGIADKFDVTWTVNTQGLDNGKKAPKVKREDPITLTVKTLKGGNTIRGVPIKVELGKATGRTKAALVDPTAQFEIAGKIYKNGDIYIGNSDLNGELVIVVTDAGSVGLKTPVLITVNEGTGAKIESQIQDVIFTVITSPDTDKANYWGHMFEIVSTSVINPAEKYIGYAAYLINRDLK
ncbi:inverse autotransporter beta domain-containing protein [Xenorhabdus hominickii]|uniref:Adhesin/invasin n=1 Tax=Xenorhabdus hominickii TaxID=351679 RepID=A0A2G0QFX4_XENHO|nr:inverse autotransporter beta domain-containing protein [Xenorhabdus hominickii]AOM42120.1 hypothetical protein A9255_17100 [Xenorhabdus hominickii]PHM58117.1 adhesin/invasin [Xenorhabdus hominickii]